MKLRLTVNVKVQRGRDNAFDEQYDLHVAECLIKRASGKTAEEAVENLIAHLRQSKDIVSVEKAD